MTLELWKVKEHEAEVSVRKIATGRNSLWYQMEKLAPGNYFVCDDFGNLLNVIVQDARESEAQQGAAVFLPFKGEDGDGNGRMPDGPGAGRVAG